MNNINEMVYKYKIGNSSDNSLREKIIIEGAELVKVVAGKLNLSLGTIIDFDDLTSYGIVGLIKALDSFNIKMDVQFNTYASIRIRGEILDEIRKLDKVGRTIRNRQKVINAAKTKLINEGNNNPTIKEIATCAGLTEEQFLEMEAIIELDNMQSLDASMDSDNKELTGHYYDLVQDTFITPEESIDKECLKNTIAKALYELTEREREVIVLAYYEELTLVEISTLLDVTAARVSQLHKKALVKLKNVLEHELDYGYEEK